MTLDDYRDHCNDFDGYCTTCKEITRYGETEPDAEGYECPDCGEDTCYGIELALLLGHLEIDE